MRAGAAHTRSGRRTPQLHRWERTTWHGRSVSADLRERPGLGDRLDEVSVDLTRGKLTAIMGPSGSGKSTLMHCLAALDTPTAGRIVIDGIDLAGLKDRALTQLRRDRLGFVFQAYNLVPTLSARENITLPVDIAGRELDQAWFDTVVDTPRHPRPPDT